MQVNNIFCLVGSDENAVTKSLAFILNRNKKVLRELLKLVDLKYLSKADLRNTGVVVQAAAKGRREITDLEIECRDKFSVIIESKIGERRPDEGQLRKYAQRLLQRATREKRLVLLTEIDETNWYEHCFGSDGRFCGLSKREYIHLQWHQIHDMMFQRLLRPKIDVDLNKMFLEYLDGMFMPEEILVVAADSQQEFEILQKHHFYRFPVKGAYPKKKAMYLGVYYKGIEHIARIIEYKVMKPKNMRPLPQIYPEAYGAGTKSGEEDFYKVVIGPLIKLPFKITNPRGHRVAYRYTTFDKLLTAKYVHEL